MGISFEIFEQLKDYKNKIFAVKFDRTLNLDFSRSVDTPTGNYFHVDVNELLEGKE